jgi:hypothetical protein
MMCTILHQLRNLDWHVAGSQGIALLVKGCAVGTSFWGNTPSCLSRAFQMFVRHDVSLNSRYSIASKGVSKKWKMSNLSTIVTSGLILKEFLKGIVGYLPKVVANVWIQNVVAKHARCSG